MSDNPLNKNKKKQAWARQKVFGARLKLRNKWLSLRRTILHLPDNLPLSALPQKVGKVISEEGVRGIVERWHSQHNQMMAHTGFVYEQWLVNNEPDSDTLHQQRLTAEALEYRPLISVLMPVWNTPPDVLEEAIQSVVNQTYSYWQFCIVDGSSTEQETKEVLGRWRLKDERIRLVILKENGGIAHNTNVALEIATGEFVALLDHDDALAPFALYEVATALNQNRNIDVIYSDEDKISAEGKRHSPFFKPDWSPELLLSFMYVGHLTVYRKSIVDRLGGFRSAYNLSQDYDLLLRVVELTDKILHIRKILYHWRTIPGSAASGGKSHARDSNLAALEDAMVRRGKHSFEIVGYRTANRVHFQGLEDKTVSIIIPSDSAQQIVECIESIFSFTYGFDYEVLVVTNRDTAKEISQTFQAQSHIKVVAFSKPFNFSEKCNAGASEATGDFLLFLNDDIRILEADWLSVLLEPFEQEGVGAVSPKLLYETDLIQHAGLVTGVRNLIGTAFHQQSKNSVEYNNFVQSLRNVSALSAACMMIPKEYFWKVEGFDAINTPIMHSDVDISFKLRELGLRLVYTPFTALRHIGHVSIGKFEQKEENVKHSNKADMFLLKRWGRYTSEDPYYTQPMRDLLYYDSPVSYSMFGDNNRTEVFGLDVMLVTHDLSLSGAPIILNSIAAYITKKTDFFTSLFSPCTGELLKQYRELGLVCVIDPLVLESPRSFQKIIDDHDVIVINTIVCWRMVLEAKRLNKPVLWLVHEGMFGLSLVKENSEIKRALEEADLVVFPSRGTEMIYKQILKGINFRVVNYGIRDCFYSANIDRENVSTSITNERIQPTDKKLKLLSIGSIEPRKGQDVIIDSLLSMKDGTSREVELSFIGRILDKDYYSKIHASSQDVMQSISFLGQLPQSQVLDRISEADIVICASRDETGPIFLLEAMMMAKCVISTPVGLIPDFIQDMKNGLIFGIDDYRELAECLEKLLRDRSLASSLGCNARKTYLESFQIETYGERIIDCITTVHASSSQ